VADHDSFKRFRIPANRRPSGRLELELRCLVLVTRALRYELATTLNSRARGLAPLSWTERRRAWARGFMAHSAVLYRLNENDPADYISDFAYARRGYKINGFFNSIVGNKLVLAQILAAHGIPTPKVLAVIVRGRLIDSGGKSASTTVDHLTRLAGEGAKLVFRPHWSGGGQGVFFLRRSEGGWDINGEAASDNQLTILIASLDRYLVTPYVEQAAYARAIFPDAANTIRVLTLWDEEREPFVAAAVHRFGSLRSLPVDNWHQGRGGVCAAIDRATGTLGRAAKLDERGRLEWRSSHPETGATIEGVRIPRLAAALAGIVQAARCFPEAPCVGWDALICDDGFAILEANSPPGLAVWQVHTPLLADRRIARFFASYGIRT
jgi:hypothetical protein